MILGYYYEWYMVFWGAEGTDLSVTRAREGIQGWARALSALLMVAVPVGCSVCFWLFWGPSV